MARMCSYDGCGSQQVITQCYFCQDWFCGTHGMPANDGWDKCRNCTSTTDVELWARMTECKINGCTNEKKHVCDDCKRRFCDEHSKKIYKPDDNAYLCTECDTWYNRCIYLQILHMTLLWLSAVMVAVPVMETSCVTNATICTTWNIWHVDMLMVCAKIARICSIVGDNISNVRLCQYGVLSCRRNARAFQNHILHQPVDTYSGHSTCRTVQHCYMDCSYGNGGADGCCSIAVFTGR